MTISEVVAPLSTLDTLVVFQRADAILRGERAGRYYAGQLTDEEFKVLTKGLRDVRTDIVLQEQGLINRRRGQ